MSNPVLDRLRAERAKHVEFISTLLARVDEDQRDLVDAETAALNQMRERIAEIDAQIEPLEAFEETRQAHEATVSHVVPTAPGEPQRASLGVTARAHKYATAGHFLVDYVAGRGLVTPADVDARQRAESALGRSLSTEERAVAKQITSDTPGLMPENIVGDILSDLDAARPFVTSVGAKPLGTIKGKKFSRPVITQHTTVGKQTAEKSELPSRKLVIGAAEFTKETYGGALNVSRQEIDWTDPAAWNAIVKDLQDVYGVETEDATAAAFAAGVTQEVTIAAADQAKLTAWIDALYSAAVMATTANGTKRASSLRLPNKIWTSIDMWGSLGSLLTANKTLLQQAGKASPTAFDGDILDIERVMAPGLPAGTMIVGRAGLFEFYEERIGLLQAVEPALLGVEIAYGGYAASGFLDATAFAKIKVGA